MTAKEFQNIRSTTASEHQRRLLVVDDDLDICTIIRRYFDAHGFDVIAAHDATAAKHALQQHDVDVILLDLGLPGEDGLSFARTLRNHWHGGLIIISGESNPTERVVGLELGADDYVCKPFDLRELLARVRSLLRRTQSGQQPSGANAGRAYAFDEFQLDIDLRRMTRKDGSEVPLTSGEFDLLCAFLDHPNQVLARDQLMQRIHRRGAGPFDRAIDVQIGRLRQKIEVDPASPLLIKSVRGVGYLFAARVLRK